MAMAATPQNSTRAAARTTGAPPSFAPVAPRTMRPITVTTTVTHMRSACPYGGSTASSGSRAPIANDRADATAACSGRALA